jgi:branched-chain amino acid transport system permease protein
MPLGVAWVVALGVAVLLGCLSEWLLYRPLQRRGASPEVAFVSSLGAFVLLVNALALAWGSGGQTMDTPLQQTGTWRGLIVSGVQVWQLVAFGLVGVALFAGLMFTPHGRVLRAARDNPLLLRVLGFDLDRVRLAVFALGSLLAGLAGGLNALDVGVEPYGGFTLLLYTAIAVIIGGVGVFHGGIVGGLLLGLVQGLVAWRLSSGWEEASVFLLLLLFLFARPQGIFGRRQRVEEF